MYRLKPYFHFFEVSFEFLKKHQSISATILAVTSFFLVFTFFSASAKADGNDTLKNIRDYYKVVIEQQPYSVEVCKNVSEIAKKSELTLENDQNKSNRKRFVQTYIWPANNDVTSGELSVVETIRHSQKKDRSS